jgi:hypothetical protein
MYPKDKKYRLGKKHSEGEQKEFSTWQKLDKYARSNLTPKIILFSFLSVIFAVILSFFLILWTTYNPRIQNKIQN